MSALLDEAPGGAPAATAGAGLTVVRGPAPLLSASGPAEWFASHLPADRPTDLDAATAGSVPPGWLRLEDVLADGAAPLAASHHRVLAGEGRGGTAQMAAKWVLSWTVGPVASLVGLVLGAGSAGLLLDRDLVRVRVHPDGWVDRVDPGACQVLVTPEHPWAGRPDVRVVADETELVLLTVDALVAALRPVVDAVRGLARVGARSLWAEVADHLGLATTYRADLPGRADVVARLQAAVTAPGAPWRVSPTLRTTTAPWGDAVYVGQKGGCCLAYQRPSAPADPSPEDRTPTDDLREFQARFDSRLSDGKDVCGTCSLRDQAGCDARQLFWLDRMR